MCVNKTTGETVKISRSLSSKIVVEHDDYKLVYKPSKFFEVFDNPSTLDRYNQEVVLRDKFKKDIILKCKKDWGEFKVGDIVKKIRVGDENLYIFYPDKVIFRQVQEWLDDKREHDCTFDKYEYIEFKRAVECFDIIPKTELSEAIYE